MQPQTATLQVAAESRSLSSNGPPDAFPAESQQERGVYLAEIPARCPGTCAWCSPCLVLPVLARGRQAAPFCPVVPQSG